MRLSRRSILKSAGALPLLAGSFGLSALVRRCGADGADGVRPAEIPPVLFVHGNGDHAALWITTLWRMESNGVPRERMLAINFTDPLARTDDKVEQANRSSTEDQRRELGEAVKELQRRTGASRIALVGNSRGGYSIRNYIKNGGGADISHAVLCGVPNHGVYDWDDGLGGEFNGRGPFLRGLNEGESEVTPGTAFLTLRSDGIDKFAQADGRFVGKPGTPTGVTSDGPALKGATNLVLGALDHREVAFHPRAFREIYKFIAGQEPSRIEIVPEAEVKLSGLVTGTPGGVVTNRPVSGATVEIYRVSRRHRRTHRRSDPFVANRRRRPLGPGAGRAGLVSRNRAGIGRLAHDASLSLAVSALLRRRASARRAPARAGRCRRGRRGPDVASAGLSRPAAGCGADRRQGAEGREIRRADRFGHDLAACRGGGWPPGGSHVQYRANRGAGLAGLGEPHCGCRTDLLAVLDGCAFMAPGSKDIV